MKKVNFLDISMAYWINIFVKFEISVFIRDNSGLFKIIFVYFMNLLRLYFCLLYISELSIYFNVRTELLFFNF